MFNYLVGAVGLGVNVASALALHLEAQQGRPTHAMMAYCAMMLWFLLEYLWHEHVHTYTYDIFRERTGYKMCWGCFCFYPFFYPIGVWALVDAPRADDLSVAAAGACVALFLAGWCLTRGANLQKFYHRTGQPWWALSGHHNATVPGSNGRLLCGGFWGISGHSCTGLCLNVGALSRARLSCIR